MLDEPITDREIDRQTVFRCRNGHEAFIIRRCSHDGCLVALTTADEHERHYTDWGLTGNDGMELMTRKRKEPA